MKRDFTAANLDELTDLSYGPRPLSPQIRLMQERPAHLFHERVQMAVAPDKIIIDLSRDSLFNDFTLQTFKERYLLPGETSPQHAFARASAAFADDEAHAQRLYDHVSNLDFMFATPLLSNGGSQRGLPISCFLNVAEDSREGIFDHFTETGWLSSVGGGVGGYWGDLRSNGEKTGRGSSSTGVIPFISTVDRLILAVSQGGTRRGSYAAYLDISHPEIEEFITMRKTSGGDQNRKGTNLHNAVNITDDFMMAVEHDLPFNLTSPKTGETIKTVRARDLWKVMIETRMQTGEPYMVFIDTINRALPEAQKALGLRVRQSNLCVAPYTEILTADGHKPIASLEGQEVEVWNGEEFSTVTIQKTSDMAELVRVWFSDGDYIDCTPAHNFYLIDGTKVPAAALKNGDLLEGHTKFAPVIDTGGLDADSNEFSLYKAYAAGWTTFAGYEQNGRLTTFVPFGITDEDGTDWRMKKMLANSVNAVENEHGLTISYEPETVPSGHVPFEWNYDERMAWLGGALAAVGQQDPQTLVLSIASPDVDTIREMRLLALELGLTPEVRLTETSNVLMFDEDNIAAMWTEHYADKKVIAVADVHPLPFKMATYCATEPKRGRLTFNGYVTGNCTEITLPSGRDFNGLMRTAVCCLSSINGERYDIWKNDIHFIPDLLRMLDNALSVFISDAPPSLHNAVYSAMRERSVGLGLLGFQAYLQSRGIAMESAEARAVNLEMFSHLKREADKASIILGAERGEAPDMAGTGERFAHKLAIAPNASSSILCGGTSPSIEPHRANAYLHKTLSGSFPVKNRHLEVALEKIGLNNNLIWASIIANEGSVQQLSIPDDLKAIFKTAMEIEPMALVQLAADRAPLICQAQSLNLFFEAPDPEDFAAWAKMAETLTIPHFMAWKLGVKSLYYLRSTTPKRAENTNTKVERSVMGSGPTEGPGGASGASYGPAADEGCLACEA
jgi:ribonucleoside-diphosphate reductase alpha chain